MNRITEDDLIVYSQVYDVYKLYAENAKKRIPKKFIQKLEKITKNNSKYTGRIKTEEDLANANLSKEAKKLIAVIGIKI